MENNNCLYIHLKPNGKIFYVGISKDLKRPYNKHGRTNYWKQIVNKYGYEVQILKKNLTKKEACELEKMLISWFGRLDLKTGCLVNMTDGGDGTSNKSIETRTKISISQLGDKNHMFGKCGKLNPNYGNLWDDEQKQIASDFNKGRFEGENNPNYGKVASFKTRELISKNHARLSGKDSSNTKIIIDIITSEEYYGLNMASKSIDMNWSTLRAMLQGRNENKTSLLYKETLNLLK